MSITSPLKVSCILERMKGSVGVTVSSTRPESGEDIQEPAPRMVSMSPFPTSLLVMWTAGSESEFKTS